jgi:hypothetical protein
LARSAFSEHAAILNISFGFGFPFPFEWASIFIYLGVRGYFLDGCGARGISP